MISHHFQNPATAFRLRQGSSTFYLETDQSSHIYEGSLFKRGAIVKNWKQRWFMLDMDKGEVSLTNVHIPAHFTSWYEIKYLMPLPAHLMYIRN